MITADATIELYETAKEQGRDWAMYGATVDQLRTIAESYDELHHERDWVNRDILAAFVFDFITSPMSKAYQFIEEQFMYGDLLHIDDYETLDLATVKGFFDGVLEHKQELGI